MQDNPDNTFYVDLQINTSDGVNIWKHRRLYISLIYNHVRYNIDFEMKWRWFICLFKYICILCK